MVWSSLGENKCSVKQPWISVDSWVGWWFHSNTAHSTWKKTEAEIWSSPTCPSTLMFSLGELMTDPTTVQLVNDQLCLLGHSWPQVYRSCSSQVLSNSSADQASICLARKTALRSLPHYLGKHFANQLLDYGHYQSQNGWSPGIHSFTNNQSNPPLSLHI